MLTDRAILSNHATRPHAHARTPVRTQYCSQFLSICQCGRLFRSVLLSPHTRPLQGRPYHALPHANAYSPAPPPQKNSNLSPLGGGRLSERGMLSLSGGSDQMFNFNAQDLDQFHLASKTKTYGSPVRSPTKSETSYPQEEMASSQNVSPTPGAFSFLRDTMGMTSTIADAAMMTGAELEGGDGMMDPDGIGMEGGAEDGVLPVGGTAEMPEMVTGEDAINFFALYRATSSVKFVHLVREHTGINFRPYDLKVIPAAECETGGAGSDQYFTMSAAGLVHVRPGEPSEFIPLGEWMRQSTLFNMLRSIRFFKYYLHSKCFTMWHQNVRFKLYCQQRAKLKNRMFLAKESFCEPLLELKKEMLDVQNVALLDFKVSAPPRAPPHAPYRSPPPQPATKHAHRNLGIDTPPPPSRRLR